MWDYEMLFKNGRTVRLKTDRMTEVWMLIQKVCIEEETELIRLWLH